MIKGMSVQRFQTPVPIRIDEKIFTKIYEFLTNLSKI